jgi:hypothetical protein
MRHLGILADFLSDEYPALFKKGEYTHPVKGVCKTLIIKSLDNKEIDFTRINRINIDYINNWVQIEVNTPLEVLNIRDFIKDPTVM